MSKEVVKSNGKVMDFKKEAGQYLFSQKINISDGKKMLFLKLAEMYKLNPFKREIYAVPFYNSVIKSYDFEPVTAYNVYIARAEETGKLDGWECVAKYLEGRLFGAEITIYRKDFSKPVKWQVKLSEFIKTKKDGHPNKTWASMPEFMIKKVCIGQGFRLAFPNELGSMPYLSEEMESEIEQDKTVELSDNQTEILRVLETVGKNLNQKQVVYFTTVTEAGYNYPDGDYQRDMKMLQGMAGVGEDYNPLTDDNAEPPNIDIPEQEAEQPKGVL